MGRGFGLDSVSMPIYTIPECPQRSFLIGVYPDLGVVPEVGRGAPQDRDGAPDLDVGGDAVVLVQQRLEFVFGVLVVVVVGVYFRSVD